MVVWDEYRLCGITATHQLGVLAVIVLLVSELCGQGIPNVSTGPTTGDAWSFNLVTDGYIVAGGQSYTNPTFAADRKWLHLETRYNYENLRTGSFWVGYNLSAGTTLVLDITPMIGGVVGRTTGIAPGCEAILAYKRIALSISNEYVFNTIHSSGSFYYNESELKYSPVDWLHLGLAADHTKALHSSLAIQRGVLLGVSHKNLEFTTYLFNAGWTHPTLVLELGVNF